MEPQKQPTDQDQGGGGKNAASSFLGRQSSTRWTPTTDQIRILKDLYYNSGVRSPSAEQIQRISAKLRQYGKIEGKNVFYWFQNHKARERQKKRFTADIPMHKPVYAKFPSINPSGNFPSSSSSNSAGLMSVGNYGYGSMAMETSFRECSINPNPNANYAWIGVDPYASPPYPNFLEKRRYATNDADQTLELAEEDDNEAMLPPEIETLPLFPMHGDVKQEADYFSGWHRHSDDGGRASLELKLNSYAAGFPSS